MAFCEERGRILAGNNRREKIEMANLEPEYGQILIHQRRFLRRAPNTGSLLSGKVIDLPVSAAL